MLKSGDSSHPPLLWGDWRCTASDRMWIAECAACGGSLWVHRNGLDDWRVTCANGCARADIEAAAEILADEQRAEQRYRDELKATMEPDDPFYGIEATRYIEALTGRAPTRGGFFQCPFHADGNERTPSLHATDILPARWYCHACHEGGTIYDFAALLWGIEPRAEGFGVIRDRLAREFIGSASASSSIVWPEDAP